MDTRFTAKRDGKDVTVDPRLHFRLKQEAHRRGLSIFALANEIIADGLPRSERKPSVEHAEPASA